MHQFVLIFCFLIRIQRSEADHCGIDFRPGVKDVPADIKFQLNPGEALNPDRKGPILPASRFGTYPLGHLPLNTEDHFGISSEAGHQVPDQRGGDIIGEIPDDLECSQWLEPLPVKMKGVSRNDPGRVRPPPKESGQFQVFFQDEEVCALCRQNRGQGTQARADFKDPLIRFEIQAGNDSSGRVRIGQKVLAEIFFRSCSNRSPRDSGRAVLGGLSRIFLQKQPPDRTRARKKYPLL